MDEFTENWLIELFNSLKEKYPEEYKESIKLCSAHHFRHLKMDEMLKDYIGNLPGFLEFISKEWGWKITVDNNSRLIYADENKDFCVCPLVKDKKNKFDPILCYCSEGFAERMFSMVIGKPVRAEVIKSVLKGNKSCVYMIKVL